MSGCLAWVFVWLMALHCFCGTAHSNFVADHVVTSLLSQYEKGVRPMCDGNSAVHVSLDVALRQIVELNVRRQILQGNLWIRMTWNDCRLQWNASDMGGVSAIALPQSRVWTPDLTLYDNADKSEMPESAYRVRVTSSGGMTFNVPAVVYSLCQIDVTRFPFDQQHCNLSYGSWAYNGLDLNLTNKFATGDTESYVKHVEWKLVSMKAALEAPMFEGVPFPIVKYTLHLRRKPLFYVINLLFPCMLITLIATLGFLLPPDAGEKVNLAITVLLSLAVFELIVLDMMPPTSETLPVIGLYFSASMVLVGFSCLMTVVVLNTHYKGNRGRRVPAFVMTLVVHKLGRLLCVAPPRSHSEGRLSPYTPSPTSQVEDVVGTSYTKRLGAEDVCENGPSKQTVDVLSASREGEDLRVADLNPLLNIFHNIQLTLTSLGNHIAENELTLHVEDDWHLVAIILDRAFMLLYFFSNVIVMTSFILISIFG